MKKTLENIEDVESAFNDLQTLEAQMQAATAGANEQIAQIRDTVVPKVALYEERITRVKNMITEFAIEHATDETLFPPGRKTLDLMSGTIQIRKSPASLVLREGWKESDVIAELREADTGVKKAGMKEQEPKLDKTGLKKLYDAGKIDDKTLKTLGLIIKEDESILISTKTIDKVEV